MSATVKPEDRNDGYAAMTAVAGMREALRECLEHNEGCFANHYGDNPEGGPTPGYILRARAILSAPDQMARGAVRALHHKLTMIAGLYAPQEDDDFKIFQDCDLPEIRALTLGDCRAASAAPPGLDPETVEACAKAVMNYDVMKNGLTKSGVASAIRALSGEKQP